jgi:histidinol-phosphatase (PHP family)
MVVSVARFFIFEPWMKGHTVAPGIDFSSDYHVHTRYSDGIASIRETIEAAVGINLRQIALTDHMPLPFPTRYAMHPEDLDRYRDDIRRIRTDYEDRIRVQMGLEMEYLPGFEDWTEKIVQSGWEYTIGSIHGLIPKGRHGMVNGTREEFDQLLHNAFDGSIRAFCTYYYKRLQTVIDSGLFVTVGHLDVFKKHNAHQAYFQEDESWYRELVLETLAHAGKAGMQIEINLAGFDHPVAAPYPSPWIIADCVHRKLPLVVGSDTHRLQNIGRNLEKLAGVLDAIGLGTV